MEHNFDLGLLRAFLGSGHQFRDVVVRRIALHYLHMLTG